MPPTFILSQDQTLQLKYLVGKNFFSPNYNRVDPALPISSVTYWSLQVIELFKLTTCSQRKKQETISYSSFKVQCLFRQIVKGHLLNGDNLSHKQRAKYTKFQKAVNGVDGKFLENF